MKTTKSIIIVLFTLLTAQMASAYYCPSTGHWLSRDPMGEPGFENLRAAGAMPRIGRVTSPIDELFLQMKGPHAILEDTNIIQELNLSKEQISQMNDDFNSDGQFLSLLRQRFLRLQIQPMRKRDRADLDSEMKSLVQVIKEVEKDRDAGLLAVLNDEQRRSWDNLCGAPVNIDWKVDFFSDAPFQQTPSRTP